MINGQLLASVWFGLFCIHQKSNSTAQKPVLWVYSERSNRIKSFRILPSLWLATSKLLLYSCCAAVVYIYKNFYNCYLKNEREQQHRNLKDLKVHWWITLVEEERFSWTRDYPWFDLAQHLELIDRMIFRQFLFLVEYLIFDTQLRFLTRFGSFLQNWMWHPSNK